jgi:glycine/D-amino acid oxidase-like deaminating enzyme
VDTRFYSDDVTFTPYWWEAAPRVPAPVRPLPERTDVAIVGSGYSGLSAALTLARAGREVVVLEKDDPGYGASSRNGGAFGANLRISFATMIGKFGLAQATAYYRGAREALATLADTIESEKIDCHFARVGRFMGAHRPGDYEAQARDLELQRKHLGFDGEMVPRNEQRRYVGTDHYHGGRYTAWDGNLHPGLYHTGLLARAQAAGATVIGRTAVTAVARDGDGFVVATDNGRLRADRVVMATNGYTGSLSPWLKRRLIPLQSQIIATEPLSPNLMATLMPGSRQLGDTCRLHHYYRTSPDGRRILFGGRAGQREVNDPRSSGTHLYKRLVALFPELREARITHSWAGFIAYTFDHLPHMAEEGGIHYAAGYCGSGVAMATYLGRKTALKILGAAEAANPFDRAHPTRPLYTGRPWFMGPIIWYKGMQDALHL